MTKDKLVDREDQINRLNSKIDALIKANNE